MGEHPPVHGHVGLIEHGCPESVLAACEAQSACPQTIAASDTPDSVRNPGWLTNSACQSSGG